MFKIELRKTKRKSEFMTTRKNSKPDLGVTKAEIFTKLKEISHNYSESTNINSKGSSGSASWNNSSTIKADDIPAHHLIGENKAIIKFWKQTRNNEIT